MASIEKTVFISYRRKYRYEALAVYQYLTGQQYDVFLDYESISSGDFEQIIVSNIKARAHFVLILTPTALDRCGEPGDWLRREIETAIDEKRNIVPLFFDDFSFTAPGVADKLTGKLGEIRRYNGLEISPDYFREAMEKLCEKFLNVPLDAVIHPVPSEVRKVVRDEQVAADRALRDEKENIDKLVKPAMEKSELPEPLDNTQLVQPRSKGEMDRGKTRNWRLSRIGAGILVAGMLGIVGITSLIRSNQTPGPTLGATAELPTASHTSPSTPPAANTTSSSPSTVPTSLTSMMTSEVDGMKLLYVPASEFTMGSEIRLDNATPVHTVFLNAFWIDQTEVTNAMYAKCVERKVCKQPKEITSAEQNSYYDNPEFDEFPVIYVSWEDAKTYCEWVGRRLPTEAEWEKAARGEDAFAYPWNNRLPDDNFLNYNKKLGDTTKVGSYPEGASPYGALDMAGNVREWVSSLYMPYPYDADDGREDMSSSGNRVLRGGAWDRQGDRAVSSTHRSWNSPRNSNNTIGFRCASSP